MESAQLSQGQTSLSQGQTSLSQGQTSLSQGQTSLSKKQEWYLKHKDDPVYMERMRESRRKYYEKNKKDQSEKALDRYYAKIGERILAK